MNFLQFTCPTKTFKADPIAQSRSAHSTFRKRSNPSKGMNKETVIETITSTTTTTSAAAEAAVVAVGSTQTEEAVAVGKATEIIPTVDLTITIATAVNLDKGMSGGEYLLACLQITSDFKEYWKKTC